MTRRGLLVASCLLVAACTQAGTATTAAPVAPSTNQSTSPAVTTLLPEIDEEVLHAEMIATPDGRVLLAYTTATVDGSDVWLSVLEGDSAGEPVLVSHRGPGLPVEEFRPSVAVSEDGEIAVAWTSPEEDVYVAISGDGGATFGSATRMNLDPRNGQLLPVVAYGGSILYATWIDAGLAPEGAEEPADLQLWTRSGDRILVTNLTGTETPSVCGCCRPHLEVEDHEVRITFRHTTGDGYRDPYRIVRDPAGNVAGPTPVAPPTWQIDACPIAGPVAVGDRVMWYDSSTGQPRILLSNGPDTGPDVVLGSGDGFRVMGAPRLVGGRDDLVLVPGQPESRLVTADGDLLDLDLPEWATAAVAGDGKLLVVGPDDGELRAVELDLP